jgi:hypothetical protein
VNAWIRGGPRDVDAVIDSYAELEDPGTRALKRIYNGGDHIHLSPLGYNTLANLIYSNLYSVVIGRHWSR